MANEEIEERLLQLILEKKSVTDKMIKSAIPDVEIAILMRDLNKLLAKGKIDLLTKNDGTMIFKYNDKTRQSVKSKNVGNEIEEQMIFDIIEESGSQGILSQEIRIKTNLVSVTVEKFLRKLVQKNRITSFYRVSAPTRKRYILSNLEPDSDPMDKAWYSGKKFDSPFVEFLSHSACLMFLKQKQKNASQNFNDPLAIEKASYASAKDVWQWLTQGKITNVEVNEGMISALLEMLIYDGKVVKTVLDGQPLYKARNNYGQISSFATVPCGRCPQPMTFQIANNLNGDWLEKYVPSIPISKIPQLFCLNRLIDDCDDIGNITPLSCKYLQQWMEF